MPRDRKTGQLRLEGDSPMRLVEFADESIEAWTPDEEAATAAVGASIKTYIKAAESLASGKYAHLLEKIPEYMTSPGNVLVAVCSDGVVIRYERKGLEERKLIVAVIRESIADATSMLSQNLVHVQSPEVPLPLEDSFGVEFKLTVHSPSQGSSRDIASARVWF